ncbi:MAG: hypothetical protein GY778_14990 [bacterium]|nr:hypothetical protein [bacterium]
MKDAEKQRQLDAFLQEYGKQRDEIGQRIELQNRTAERSIQLTFLTVTLLAALFTFYYSETDYLNMYE